jgi:hypothetical protein
MEQSYVPPKDQDVDQAVDELESQNVEDFVENEFGRVAPVSKGEEQKKQEKMERVASQSFSQRNLVEARAQKGELSKDMIDKMVEAEIGNTVAELRRINPEMSATDAKKYLDGFKESYDEMVAGERQREKKRVQDEATENAFNKRVGHAEDDAIVRAERIQDIKAETADNRDIQEFLAAVSEEQFRSSPDFPGVVRELVQKFTKDANEIAGMESYIYETLDAKYPKKAQQVDLGKDDLSDSEIDDLFK